MLEKILEKAKRTYDPKQRLIALSFEGIFFLGILPILLKYVSHRIDAWLHIPPFDAQGFLFLLGSLFIISGFAFALWSIYVQFTIGKGTPVPMMATQKLIITKPYNYCRNPMALGTIVLYLGMAICFGSFSAIALVFIGSAFLLTYIKLFEEKEMIARFGESYLIYKEHTPFIIPRFRRRK